MKPLYFFTLLCCIAAHSQTITKYSASFKGTTYIFADRFETGVELNAFSKKHLFTLGYYFDRETSILSASFQGDIYRQLNLLIGGYSDTKNEKFRMQYQAGVGQLWIKRRAESSEEVFRTTQDSETTTLPLRIGGRYMPFPFLSIGIDILANINEHKTLLRPMLSIEIGKLRNK